MHHHAGSQCKESVEQHSCAFVPVFSGEAIFSEHFNVICIVSFNANTILLTARFTARRWVSFEPSCGFGRREGILADYHFIETFAFIFKACINMQACDGALYPTGPKYLWSLHGVWCYGEPGGESLRKSDLSLICRLFTVNVVYF